VRTRPPPVLTAEETAAVRSWVIHEDAHVIAINKPGGLTSQGGVRHVNTLDDLLWAFARSNGKRPELVHRLDRDTSGVILSARTKPAAGFLGKAIQARKLTKTYLALVSEPPVPPSGRIETPLLRVEVGRESWIKVADLETPGAQASQSRYRTLASSEDGALIELEPFTGRMHQLRVHMASIGRPLIGDVKYGGALTAAGRAAPRLMLHAASLDFPHPEGGRMTISAPPPEDFRSLAEAIGVARGLPSQSAAD